MENPIKMDDLGVPIIFGNTHIMLLCNLAFSVVSLADNGSNPLPYKEEIWWRGWVRALSLSWGGFSQTK